jgi:IclR family acetate operon transcriptional repressor
LTNTCLLRRYRVSIGGSQPRGRPRRVVAHGPAGQAELDDPFLVRAFWKGLQVLGLFDAGHTEWTVADLAAATGVPKATAYRLARTMEAGSYLVLDPLTGRYHLGPALVALTYLSKSYSELGRMARAFLEGLAAGTGETVNLAVEIDGQAVLVDEVRTRLPFKSVIPLGRIIGDTANSNGKVFAAFKPEAERQRIAAAAHQALTEHTIVDPGALLQEFERVRREGIAYDMEERSLGVCAVGAPVRDQEGQVVAAISVIVPKGRFGPNEQKLCAQAIREAAASLSAYLGHSTASED